MDASVKNRNAKKNTANVSTQASLAQRHASASIAKTKSPTRTLTRILKTEPINKKYKMWKYKHKNRGRY